MVYHRFFIEGLNVNNREISLKDDVLYHQLKNVLRMRTGETIVLLDNSGLEYNVRIDALSEGKIEGYVLSSKQCDTEPSVKIYLYQSLLKKKEKFEFVLQKGTEIGVSTFVPLRTERCEFQGKMEMSRCMTIVREAAEQSHRGILPELIGERVLSDVLKESAGLKLLFDPLGEKMETVLGHSKNETTHLFIGPEGGFSPAEVALAEKQGAKIVSVGKRILRSETAGIVIPALVLRNIEEE